LKQIHPKVLKKLYGIGDWEDCDDFLETVARRLGKLRKGNVPDTLTASKVVMTDW